MSPRYRPTWATVNLSAIRHNVRVLKPANSELMVVVKANAYGHGDVAVARAALKAGATWVGVALVEEGLGLREAGIDAPILVLSECPPGSEKAALAAGLTPTVYTHEGLARLADVRGRRKDVGVHVKIDTGMHRAGLWPPSEGPAFIDRVAAAGFVIEGLWTHMARAEEDEGATKEQLSKFQDVVEIARNRGHEPKYLHAANSASTILHVDTHLDLVRTGIAVYGIEPGPGVGPWLGLKPALTWRTAVTLARRLSKGEGISYGHKYRLEKRSWIATVPVGYGDGYPRIASSKAQVLIAGRRHKVAGNITMDQMMIDCGTREIAPGDEVVLVGEQGKDAITANELASHAGTIGYEIVSRIGPRVPREYVG